MNYCIDMILGKAFCLFIFFHFPDSRVSVLKGFHFYFCFLTWVKILNWRIHFFLTEILGFFYLNRKRPWYLCKILYRREFLLRYNNRGELTPECLTLACHFVVVSCKQMIEPWEGTGVKLMAVRKSPHCNANTPLVWWIKEETLFPSGILLHYYCMSAVTITVYPWVIFCQFIFLVNFWHLL